MDLKIFWVSWITYPRSAIRFHLPTNFTSLTIWISLCRFEIVIEIIWGKLLIFMYLHETFKFAWSNYGNGINKIKKEQTIALDSPNCFMHCLFYFYAVMPYLNLKKKMYILKLLSCSSERWLSLRYHRHWERINSWQIMSSTLHCKHFFFFLIYQRLMCSIRFLHHLSNR